MAAQHPMAFRLDDDIRQRLNRLAGATRRSMSFLAADALRQYLDANEWQIRAILEGIEDADAGRLIDHRDIRAEWERRLASAMD